MLVCPACQAFTRVNELKQTAADAEKREAEGDLPGALSAWRSALTMLPPNTTQYDAILQRVDALSRQVERLPPSQRAAKPTVDPASSKATAMGAAGILALVLGKAKFLIMGLTKAQTFFTMLLAFGVYWQVWGWKFAAGLVVSIYIHEMGHIAALRRLGFPTPPPLFIPGLGAVILLQQHVTSPREDARIGLAGPIWGMGAAIACLIIWYFTQSPYWLAIAHVGAYINLFNLLPFWQLDGARGFHALTKFQRFVAVAIIAAAFAASHDGLLIIIGAVALYKAIAEPGNDKRDEVALLQYVGLVAALTAIMVFSAHISPAVMN